MQDAQKPPILTIPLIFLLCAVAGSVDAIAYLLCGQIFVANMTGNTVLLAISLLQGKFAKAALRGGLVAAFLASVIVTRLLARKADRRMTKKQRICVLGLECSSCFCLRGRAQEPLHLFCYSCWPACSAHKMARSNMSAAST